MKLKKMKINLLLTGYLQALLVAVNTVLLARANYIGVTAVSFLISFVWSWNVRKVAFGGVADRILYSTGAALGGLSGLLLGELIGKIW